MGGALLLGFMAVERIPEHLGALPELTARRVIEGPVSHIRDGDTIEVAGTPVRFGSLDCAERGTVRGDAATRRMRDLVAAQSLSCALNGRTSYDRRHFARWTRRGRTDDPGRIVRPILVTAVLSDPE